MTESLAYEIAAKIINKYQMARPEFELSIGEQLFLGKVIVSEIICLSQPIVNK